MALSIHVNGEARVMTGTGASAALELFGVSVEGVEINFKLSTEDVIVDTTGPKVPLDVQYFLEEADINFDLVWYDGAILTKVLGRLGVGSGTGSAGIAGIMDAPGTLILQNNAYTRLLIMSIPASQGLSGAEPCHNFPTAWLNDTDTFRVGTRKTIHRQSWRAIPMVTSTTGGGANPANGSILWNTVCS